MSEKAEETKEKKPKKRVLADLDEIEQEKKAILAKFNKRKKAVELKVKTSIGNIILPILQELGVEKEVYEKELDEEFVKNLRETLKTVLTENAPLLFSTYKEKTKEEIKTETAEKEE